MMVAEFDTVGLGQWFRFFTGGLELVGALLLLCIDIGAFGAQVGAILAALVHWQRGQITSRLGL